MSEANFFETALMQGQLASGTNMKTHAVAIGEG